MEKLGKHIENGCSYGQADSPDSYIKECECPTSFTLIYDELEEVHLLLCQLELLPDLTLAQYKNNITLLSDMVSNVLDTVGKLEKE